MGRDNAPSARKYRILAGQPLETRLCLEGLNATYDIT